jgi:hypothetical protein
VAIGFPPRLLFRRIGSRRAMDIKLHRPQSVCSRTGRGFVPGDVFFSTLCRGEGGLERIDVAAEAWDGPPPGAIAWWRSVQPSAHEAGPALAPVEVLLDALEAFEAEEAAVDEAVRYLLALQLVRRRALKLESATDDDAGLLVFSCRRRHRDYRIRPVEAADLVDPEVGARLTALLWSGDAA